jgi:transgelin
MRIIVSLHKRKVKRRQIFLPQMEEQQKEVLAWIEAVMGERLDGRPFVEALKSGVVLCRLLNKVSNLDVGYTDSKQLFVQRENITSFINGLRRLGLNEYELFQTNDLFEEKSLKHVLISLYALSRHLQKTGAIAGPFIGPQLSSNDSQDSSRGIDLSKEAETGYNAHSGTFVGVKTRSAQKQG